YAFDRMLREDITTGDQAMANNYYNRSDHNALVYADPFFSGIGAQYAAQMQQDLANASTVLQIIPKNSSGTVLPNKSIFNLIDWILYCRLEENVSAAVFESTWMRCAVGLECRSITREWELYRNYYLKLKNRYVQLAKKASNPACTDCF